MRQMRLLRQIKTLMRRRLKRCALCSSCPWGLSAVARRAGKHLPSGAWYRSVGVRLVGLCRMALTAVASLAARGWAETSSLFRVLLKRATQGGARKASSSTAAKRRRVQAVPRRGGTQPQAESPRFRWGRWVVVGAVVLGSLVLLWRTTPSSSESEWADSSDIGSRGTESEASSGLNTPAIEQEPPTLAPGVVPSGSPYADRQHTEAIEAPPELSAAEGATTADPSLSPRVDDATGVEVGRPGDETRPARSFGDPSVPNGKTFVLRMSQPVSGVVGTILQDGFSVKVPGSLSLDRAGPIARSHDKVERAMILNHGDHAELTVRFIPGATPSYRVSYRGSSVEVTVEQ